MKLIVPFVVLLVCLMEHEVISLNLPGPRVYVVTPSTRTPHVNNGRPAPFYYRNWIKRMDNPWNATSTTSTTTTEKTKTPDLIFAEFGTGNHNMKSIRKLLEKERIGTTTTTTTTTRPIYVPDDETDETEHNYGLPPPTTTEKPMKTDMTDYFALYSNLYNTGPLLTPVYVPPSNPSTSPPVDSELPTMSAVTMQTPINNVENIWHIIDSQKNDQDSGKWKEESLAAEPSAITTETASQDDEVTTNEYNNDGEGVIDENYALPGFGTNPGNGAENESRAIRTEPNFRFPYVNLKPFQMKSSKNPLYSNGNSKKSQNMFTSLDHFQDLKNPVRGEAQDIVGLMHQPIDRYNPAQPYLPQQPYGSKSKQSSPSNPTPLSPAPPAPPVRAVANLVPPPPPSPPKITGEDFPTPSTYESFPPYAPAAPPPSPLAPRPPTVLFQSPTNTGPDPSDDSGPDSSDDSGPDTFSDDKDRPPSDIGYRYKPPSPPVPQFFPTIPPASKPFSGYSYNKPPVSDDSPPSILNKPDFQGYHYSKPDPSPPPKVHAPDSYGHHDTPPSSYQPDHDYPDLIYDKPHGGMNDMKGGNDMNDNSMGMMPPPAPAADAMPAHSGPEDDSGFPHDFPGDFKFHHDFDDHDYHHHHHTTTTTTTTTEMPRVNRYSYYYLGKKLYYLPLYFSVYFIIYVGALIIKAVLRHKISFPNSWRPNDQTASFFSKRSLDSHLTNNNLHEITGRVTRAIASAAEKYMQDINKQQ